MKKIFLLIIFFFLNFSLLFSESQWRIVDTVKYIRSSSGIPTAFLFEAIDCYDSLNCCAVGNMSKDWPWNRVTTDGGENWFTTLRDTAIVKYDKDSNRIGFEYVPAEAREISYPSKDLCIITCDSGYYWRSTDGCMTWERKQVNTTDDRDLDEIHLLNNKYGAMISWFDLFVTTDGGLNWEKKEVIAPDSLKFRGFYDVWMPNENTIMALVAIDDEESNYFIKSNDFGYTWKFYKTDTLHAHHLFFLNENIGWAAGQHQVKELSSDFKDIILHTTDGGENWEVQLDTLTYGQRWGLRKIQFSDENNGAALGIWYKLWRTTDGGNTWLRDKYVYFDNFSDYFWDLHFFNHDNIIALGEENLKIYKYSEVPNSVNNYSESYNIDLNLYPNPVFSGSKINIKFTTADPCSIKFAIYNSLGKLIEKPFTTYFDSGNHQIEYTPDADISPGVYFLKMSVDGVQIATEEFAVIN